MDKPILCNEGKLQKENYMKKSILLVTILFVAIFYIEAQQMETLTITRNNLEKLEVRDSSGRMIDVTRNFANAYFTFGTSRWWSFAVFFSDGSLPKAFGLDGRSSQILPDGSRLYDAEELDPESGETIRSGYSFGYRSEGGRTVFVVVRGAVVYLNLVAHN